MKRELTVNAVIEELPTILDLVESAVYEYKSNCSEGDKNAILIATEEIFVNIVNYAYSLKSSEIGTVTVCTDSSDGIKIEFEDSGISYNPLERAEPDFTLSLEERKIGGLGIYMVEDIMDFVGYKYKNNKNVFTMKKYL